VLTQNLEDRVPDEAACFRRFKAGTGKKTDVAKNFFWCVLTTMMHLNKWPADSGAGREMDAIKVFYVDNAERAKRYLGCHEGHVWARHPTVESLWPVFWVTETV